MQEFLKGAAILVTFVTVVVLLDQTIGTEATFAVALLVFFCRTVWSVKHGLLRHVVPGAGLIDYMIFVIGASTLFFVMVSERLGDYAIPTFLATGFVWSSAHLARLPWITAGATMTIVDGMFGTEKER